MGFFTSVSKQALKVLICFCLVYTPFFARAASLDGWTLGGGVAQGASVLYEGTKKVILNGKEYVKKGTALITPNAAQVAKQLGKGVAGVALSVAVEQLIGFLILLIIRLFTLLKLILSVLIFNMFILTMLVMKILVVMQQQKKPATKKN